MSITKEGTFNLSLLSIQFSLTLIDYQGCQDECA